MKWVKGLWCYGTGAAERAKENVKKRERGSIKAMINHNKKNSSERDNYVSERDKGSRKVSERQCVNNKCVCVCGVVGFVFRHPHWFLDDGQLERFPHR